MGRMTSSSERGARVRVPPPLIFLAALLAGLAVHAALPLRLPATGRPVAVVGGIALVALGVFTVLAARFLFLRTGQSPAPWKPSPELIACGPYRFTRNPMYVGITMFLVGLGLAVDVPWIALFAFVALAVVHFLAVVREEAYLAEKFGERYAAYTARVRRYL